VVWKTVPPEVVRATLEDDAVITVVISATEVGVAEDVGEEEEGWVETTWVLEAAVEVEAGAVTTVVDVNDCEVDVAWELVAELETAEVVPGFVDCAAVLELEGLVDEDDEACEAELTTVVPATVVTPVLSWATDVETPAVGDVPEAAEM
jgi:hypothetical protein